MTIMHISGEITVRVDAVDIEQVRLEHPENTNNLPSFAKAMFTAFRLDHVLKFRRDLQRMGYNLQGDIALHQPDDSWLVTFIILPVAEEEEDVA